MRFIKALDGTLETAMQFEMFALEKCYVSASTRNM